ncbi:MAG TPA: hypothetical protein VJH21_01780 [Candidatus Paceibacterota bacterium]
MKYSFDSMHIAYRDAHKSVKDFIGSDNSSKILDTLSLKYSFDDTKKGSLGDILIYTLLGFVQMEDFGKELQTSIGISSEEALRIIADIKSALPNQVLDDVRHQNKAPNKNVQKDSLSENKQLIDHIKAFEERKQKQKEEETKRSFSENIPPNLPTDTGSSSASTTNTVIEKPQQRNLDPYHEPIE